MPLLNAGSSSIKITDPGNPWTFRIMPNEVMQGVDIATNAYKRLNARTAVLLYENTNAGIGNAKVFATVSGHDRAETFDRKRAVNRKPRNRFICSRRNTRR